MKTVILPKKTQFFSKENRLVSRKRRFSIEKLLSCRKQWFSMIQWLHSFGKPESEKFDTQKMIL